LVEIKNFLGKSVDKIELDAWFSMPDSIRSRKVSWQRKFMFGKYTATAKINRGYDNIIDEMTVTFWVFPWKVIVALLIVIGLISWFLFWIAKNFEIKKKSLE